MKEKKYISKETKKNIFIIVSILLIILSVFLYKRIFKSKVTYTVMNGYVEKVSNVIGVVLKDETIIDMKKDASAVPIIEQGKRVGKGDIIATYKSENYENYLSQIEQVDNDIQTLIKDLPITYSVDVASIESEISQLVKEAKNTTSYLKMQEYKTKIDELSYKKVLILGELSPSGSKTRELIEKRQEIEENNKLSNDNIKAIKSGLVTYKLDNLEKEVDINNISNFGKNEFDNIFEKYSDNNSNNFGIKIVNNYLAYIAIRIPVDENDKYIKKDKIYTIKVKEKESVEVSGKLVKNLKFDNENYLLFEITDNIESLVDHRTVNLEIIWDKTVGMAVLKDAIRRNEQDTYDYVVVNGGEYLNVPIKIINSSEGICIVENLKTEEKEKLGITDNNKINLYDILVI